MPGISLSVSSYKGILYLDNLGRVQLKEPPCMCKSGLFYDLSKNPNRLASAAP